MQPRLTRELTHGDPAMKLRDLIALPLLAATATAALAQEDTSCRNGLFPTQPPFALAQVRGEERAYFHGDMNGCPWARGACSSPSYVVPGDTVIISKIRKGYACAYYPSAGGGTAGWVATRRLELKFIENRPQVTAWVGKWTSEGNPELVITRKLGGLHVSGEAFWPGRPGTHDWPSVHVGEISGPVSISGHIGKYGADENLCKVRFTLLGAYLIAGGNNRCGGANVSFSGVYTRQP